MYSCFSAASTYFNVFCLLFIYLDCQVFVIKLVCASCVHHMALVWGLHSQVLQYSQMTNNHRVISSMQCVSNLWDKLTVRKFANVDSGKMQGTFHWNLFPKSLAYTEDYIMPTGLWLKISHLNARKSQKLSLYFFLFCFLIFILAFPCRFILIQ